MINRNITNIAFQRSVAFLRPNKEIILSSYLKYLLNTKQVKSQIKRRETLSAQPGIYLNDISKIKIKISYNSKEQTKIAQILDKVNLLIDLQQRKIRLLNLIIKALQEKGLFIYQNNLPVLHFSTKNWITLPLQKIGSLKTGKPFSSKSFVKNGKYMVITNKDINSNNLRKNDRININSSDEKYILSGENILISMDGNVGEVILFNNPKAVLAQRVGRFQTKVHNLIFIFEILNNFHFKNSMNKLGVGNIIHHISLQNIGNYSIAIPQNISDESRLGNMFNDLEKNVSFEKSRLNLLLKLKRFLLQNMFI